MSKDRLDDFQKVLARLDEVLEIPENQFNSRDRDSAILRFELAYELCWKLLQDLVRNQGLESNGPRSAFQNAFKLGWIEDESVWFDMISDRNLAVHVYREELADSLFSRIPEYTKAFRSLIAEIEDVG